MCSYKHRMRTCTSYSCDHVLSGAPSRMVRPKRAHPNLSRLPHCQATAPRSQTFVSWKCPQYALSCTCVAPRLPASLACARRPAADKHPQTSISLQHATAHCCRRFRRPQQTPLRLHHIRLPVCPASTSAAPSHPRRHTTRQLSAGRLRCLLPDCTGL